MVNSVPLLRLPVVLVLSLQWFHFPTLKMKLTGSLLTTIWSKLKRIISIKVLRIGRTWKHLACLIHSKTSISTRLNGQRTMFHGLLMVRLLEHWIKLIHTILQLMNMTSHKHLPEFNYLFGRFLRVLVRVQKNGLVVLLIGTLRIFKKKDITMLLLRMHTFNVEMCQVVLRLMDPTLTSTPVTVSTTKTQWR